MRSDLHLQHTFLTQPVVHRQELPIVRISADKVLTSTTAYEGTWRLSTGILISSMTRITSTLPIRIFRCLST